MESVAFRTWAGSLVRGAACENTTVRQFTRREGELRGHAVSHAEGDLKDKETIKCEHGRDMFEVTPQLPRSHYHSHLHSTTPRPIPASLTSSLLLSLYPIWLAPPRSLGRGVVESSVAAFANDAPPLPLTPTHTHTHPHIHTHTPFSLQTNCCSDSRAPLAAPRWGESPTDTFLYPHAPRRWLAGWNTEAPHILPRRHSP